MKIQENFQQSVQQQIKEDIEETIQEELENNLDDSMNEIHPSHLQEDHEDSPDIVVTGVQTKTGLVNDPADELLQEPNQRNFEFRQVNSARPYHKLERGSYFNRPRRSRGGPRGGRGSYRAYNRPYTYGGGMPSRNFRNEFPKRRSLRGPYSY